MTEFSASELTRLDQAAELLLEAEKRLPVLRSVAWERDLADRFFAANERELPRPEYRCIDPDPSLRLIAAARGLVRGSSPVHDWLLRFADTAERTAALLDSLGTAAFHEHSCALYGSPRAPIAGGRRTALEFARRLDELLSEFDEGSLRLEPPEVFSADEIRQRLEHELPLYFGEAAPRVEVTDRVSAKAAAGRDYIKLREGALFSDLDATQLLHHEALVHIATGYNGQAQPHFDLLAESHPGNTRTQEGLAVFAEFISGSLDPHRFARLAERVIAIDMATDGADFIELYAYFREQARRDDPFEAFESARRVVRGGLVSGGAPFTKDGIYLGGLLDVHNYLRTAVRAGDTAYVRLLFVGKIALEDIDAIMVLRDEGLLEEPRYLPPWASDLRYLMAYLAYSTFLNEINLGKVAEHYAEVLGPASSADDEKAGPA